MDRLSVIDLGNLSVRQLSDLLVCGTLQSHFGTLMPIQVGASMAFFLKLSGPSPILIRMIKKPALEPL